MRLLDFVYATTEEQLGDDGGHTGRALQRRDARGVMRMNPPQLGHIVLTFACGREISPATAN